MKITTQPWIFRIFDSEEIRDSGNRLTSRHALPRMTGSYARQADLPDGRCQPRANRRQCTADRYFQGCAVGARVMFQVLRAFRRGQYGCALNSPSTLNVAFLVVSGQMSPYFRDSPLITQLARRALLNLRQAFRQMSLPGYPRSKWPYSLPSRNNERRALCRYHWQRRFDVA
jgi:hypothetical protein